MPDQDVEILLVDDNAKPVRTLLIEDSEANAELIVHELRLAGYEPDWLRVDTAEGVVDALEARQWDVVFADGMLPGYSGYSVLELLRDRGLDTPLILISGTSDEEHAVEALRAGAKDFVSQVNFARLVSAMERELREAKARAERRLAERRLTAEHAVSSILVEQPAIDEGLVRILEVVCSALGWAAALYWEVDPEQERLRYRYFWGSGSIDLEAFEAFGRSTMLKRGTGLPGLAWERNEPVWLGNVRDLAGAPAFPRARIAADVGLDTGFAFPIAVGGTTLGVVEFLSPGIQEPDPEFLAMARVIGGQIGRFVERHQAEQRLRRSEERLRGVFEAAAVGIVVVDREGKIVTSNDAFASMLGYGTDELEGADVWELTHPADRAASQELHRQLFEESSGRVHTDKRYMARDGAEVWASLRAAAMRGAEGSIEYAIGVVEDLRERRSLEAQFLQAQKMELVGQLAGGIAHDFNNLLLAITGYTELALGDLGEGNPAVRESLEEIGAAADRASKLTRDLLAFSSREVLQPTVTNLNDVVAGMERLLRRTLGGAMVLETHLEPELEPVSLDPNRLEQALMNLAINARDAMLAGGALRIETARMTLVEPKAVNGGELEPGTYSVLRVLDTGTGMDEETRRHVFEPFFTTKAEGKGTGLGLSTVFGFVMQSRGQIEVESEPGAGTTFTLYFAAG
jgi:PAS domain S-box-containing protein